MIVFDLGNGDVFLLWRNACLLKKNVFILWRSMVFGLDMSGLVLCVSWRMLVLGGKVDCVRLCFYSVENNSVCYRILFFVLILFYWCLV